MGEIGKNAWSKRDLTLFEKKHCHKNTGYPQAHSNCSVNSSQKLYINQLKRLCFTFIWGKHDRIRRSNCTCQ